MNSLKTVVLLGALTGVIILIGGYLGGVEGIIVAFLVASIMNISSYWYSDKIVLSLFGGREVTEKEAPRLHKIVSSLANTFKIPKPKVYVIHSASPNAFATGRDPQHAAVACTEGILNLLTEEELTGVLAHEFSHIVNRDTLISCISATLAGVIMMIASIARFSAIFGGMGRDDRQNNGLELLVMAFLAPIAATLIQLAISRSREYLADEKAAQMTRHPLWLADALKRLDKGVKSLPLKIANPATSHLFIVNPLRGGGFLSLFSTHPQIAERVKRLESMKL